MSVLEDLTGATDVGLRGYSWTISLEANGTCQLQICLLLGASEQDKTVIETKPGTRIKATGSHRKDTLQCKADPYCWCVIEIKKEKATINRNFSALKYVLPK